MKYADRVVLGKEGEEEIAEVLRRHGLTVLNVESEEIDMIEKIDRYLESNGRKYTLQIKFREDSDTYRDFLLDLFEPYEGDGHPNTKSGRDYVSKYDLYACRIKNVVYLVCGKAQKALVEDTLAEWRAAQCPIPVFRSKKTPGVEIRRTWDRKNRRSKLLMFIPPSVYSKRDLKEYPVNG